MTLILSWVEERELNRKEEKNSLIDRRSARSIICVLMIADSVDRRVSKEYQVRKSNRKRNRAREREKKKIFHFIGKL